MYSQLITYLGNKRSLLGLIQKALPDKIDRALDMFSGSGVVSRLLSQNCQELHVNDLELYARVISECFLFPRPDLSEYYLFLNDKIKHLGAGFITELYSPSDPIKETDRVFYTRRNAMFIDTLRMAIEELPKEIQPFFLGPLLSQASIHVNTSGVFKGFYKDNGVGKFGGKNENCLSRITGEIRLELPKFENRKSKVIVHQENANNLRLPSFDVVYLDPPYNQHPYGSNYFMLNLICEYKRPSEISKVAGIPREWNRSNYNIKRKAFNELKDLVDKLDAKRILISYNSEGFITKEQMYELGNVEVLEQEYPVFRANKNYRKVTEYLFVLKR